MKHKIKFDNIVIMNRWKTKKYSRLGDWTVFGISVRFVSPERFSYRLHFFGIDINFWFYKIFLK